MRVVIQRVKYASCTVDGKITCELNTTDHCGSHGNECTRAEGVRFVTCNDEAKCEATKCEKNYHWDREGIKCVPDSIEECGWFNNNCNALSGWKKDAPGNECKDGFNCFAGECSEGFHVFNNNEEFQEEDNDYE